MPWKSGLLVKKEGTKFCFWKKKNFLSVAFKALQIFFLQELLPCELEKPQQMIAFYIPLIRLGNLIQVGMHGNVVLFMVTLLHGINLFFRLRSLILNNLKPFFFYQKAVLLLLLENLYNFRLALEIWNYGSRSLKSPEILRLSKFMCAKVNILKI